MLAPPWIPIAIVAALWSMIVIVSAIVVARRRGRWWPVLLVAVLSGIVLAPACIGLLILNNRSNGSPRLYATTSEITDSPLAAHLPAKARSLALREHSGGFLAIFTIEPEDYAAFLDDLWATDMGRSVTPRAASTAVILDDLSEDLALRWQTSLPPEWIRVADARSDRGPAAPNGSTTRLVYSPSTRSCILERWWW